MIRIFNHYLHRQTLLRILTDMGLVVLVTLLAYLAQAANLIGILPVASTKAISLAAGLFVINTASGFYQKASSFSYTQACARAALALLILLPLTYLVIGMIPTDVQRLEMVRGATMVGVAAVVMWRVYASHLAVGTGSRTRILIYGCGPAARLVAQTLRQSDPMAQIVGHFPSPNESASIVNPALVLPVDDSLTNTAKRLSVDEIVVALTERRSGSMPLRDLLDCKLFGIRVVDVNTHFEKTLGQIRIGFANAGWMIFGDGFNQGFYRTAVKRLFDIVGAIVLIVLSLPIMLVTALLIKLDSPGPVLYRQERAGLSLKPFQVIKFRSMRMDAEKDGKPRWAKVQDDRVTRVGAVIRLLRIDELPQLFNVLVGDMSLVGPRPERPYFVEQLTEQIPYFAVRASVKPGLTGWAQVRYQYGATVEDSIEKLQYDLYYVKNHTLFLDIVILLETVVVVLTGKGAR